MSDMEQWGAVEWYVYLFPLLHSCLFHHHISTSESAYTLQVASKLLSHMKENEMTLIFQMFSQYSNEIKYRENGAV